MRFYERGPVRIRFEEAGSGFPLLIIAGGGLNSTMANLARSSPFNPIEEFKGEYRCIAADLRNANGGESTGPLEIDRPWDAYTDDHLGLMDHLGIDKFLVLPDDTPAHPLQTSIDVASLAPNAEITVFPWREPPELKDRIINRVRTFLRTHQPMRAAAQ